MMAPSVRACLRALDAVLRLARLTFRHEHSDFSDLGEGSDLFYLGRAPPRSVVIASLVVNRIDDLCSLLDAYLAWRRHEADSSSL
jgi:hypothetical protein